MKQIRRGGMGRFVMAQLRVIAPLIVGIVMFGCADSLGNDDATGRIRAVVRDDSGLGIPGVVLLLRQGSRTFTQTTAVGGTAVFEDVAAGTWAVDIEEPAGFSIPTTQADPITFSMKAGQVKDLAVSLKRSPTPPKEPPPGGGEV
jgi:hypothetical protein